jgi:signal transduction histidine kinase
MAMVLVLFWFVLVRWQFSGEISLFGLIMSLLLVLLLIVRIGIRAGEGELLIYWQLFKNVATPVFLCDRKGRIVLVNPAALSELGDADEKTLIGRKLDGVFPVEEQLRSVLVNPEPMNVFVDKRIRTRSVPFSLMFSPVFSENGKLLVAVTAYNLTEQRRSQDILTRKNRELVELSRRLEDLNAQLEGMVEERTRTLKRTLDRLEEQNKLLRDLDTMKSEFVSLVSHELRTPLTSLKGGVELILRNRNLPKKIEKTLTLMIGEVERLTKFVINILDVSSMEAGKTVINIRSIDPVPVIQNVLADLPAEAVSNRVRVEIGNEVGRVLADELVLQGALLHLLDNALKYAPEGEITLSVQQTPSRIRFQVIDHGPGIPEEKRHLLFRRFQRINTSDSQSVYGYGLGLYFSRKMIAAIKGRLMYTQLQDGRSCFQFSLQSANEEETAAR